MPVINKTAYMHKSQWVFNISFVSRRNTFVLFFLGPPSFASFSFARRKNALSGTSARTPAAKNEIPLAVQNNARQPDETDGTRYRLITAARRYPTAYPCCRNPDAIPRASTGRFSRAVEAARPQIPPMPIPKRERRARNWWKFCTKPAPSSRTPTRTRLKTRGHLRP